MERHIIAIYTFSLLISSFCLSVELSDQTKKLRRSESSNWGVFLKKSITIPTLRENPHKYLWRSLFFNKARAPGQQLYWKRSASQVFCWSHNLSFSIFFKHRNNHFQGTPSVAASNHRYKQKDCMWVYIYRNIKVKDSGLYHPKLC